MRTRVVQRMTGGKDFRHAPPRKCPAGAPRNFSAAGLIITARASRVNSSKPSSSPAITGIHIFAHGAEDFMHAAQLLADLCNLPAHQS